jgi:hypothetical protein
MNLSKKKKDEGLKSINLTEVERPLTMYRINIHKNSHNKTLHLLVELNNNLFEGLVDTCASMSIMSTTLVRELGIMHLVFKFEAYKTTFRMVNQALGKITDFTVRFGDVQCLMMFMIIDINIYDLLLGLDSLIIDFAIRFRDVQCLMMFMIVGINNYDLLLGLDFLIKICAVVEVEKRMIQIR